MLTDFIHNLDPRCSIKANSELAGTTAVSGDSVSFGDHLGPVAGLFVLGSATGSPSSFTVECKLQESATGVGSWTDVAGAQVAVLTADKGSRVIQGQRTKPYVRLLATPAFVGGSTPKQYVAGLLLAQPSQV